MRLRVALWAGLAVVLLGSAALFYVLPPSEEVADQRPAHPTGTKILIVGLDGADWQIAEPLIGEGRLPHLNSLREQGAWGDIKTLTPVLSPLLWTSVVTGTTADRHGIVDFLARDPRTGQKVPVSSRFRKVRALWNIFTDFGRTSDIVAWWATWPAEPINGHMISDRVSYSLFDFQIPLDGSGTTYPETYISDVRSQLIDDADVTYEDVSAFADVSRAEFEAARRLIERDRGSAFHHPLNHLTKILAATRNYHSIALDLLRDEQADLTAVYYQGIDEVCHRFMHFVPPRLRGIDPEDVRRYGKVVERFYPYQDRLLGELIEAASPETALIVLSDHGFVSGPDRPQDSTADIEGQPGRWHRQYGLIGLAGPQIAPGRMDTTSLLDIAPTVLYLAGLPVPEDLPGRVLAEAIRPGFRDRFPVIPIETYETTPFGAGAAPVTAELAAVEEEMLEKLRSLGYVGDATEAADQPQPAGETGSLDTVTAHTNLATIHLAKGNLASAEREILEALKISPQFRPARQQLFDLRARQKRREEAIAIGNDLITTEDPGQPRFLTRLANLYADANRMAEGITRFSKEVEAGRWQFGAPLATLLLRAGRQDEAARSARAVIRRAPLNEPAMAILFQVAQTRGRFEDAEPLLEEALKLNERSVMHLNWMAIVQESRGDVSTAESLLVRALEANPDHGGSAANLGAFYGRHERASEALPLLERALRIDPGNQEAYVNLGSAYARLGRMDDAIEQFRGAVASGVESTDVFNALAKAHGQKGELELAAEWLRRSLELNPQQPRIRQLLTQVSGT